MIWTNGLTDWSVCLNFICKQSCGNWIIWTLSAVAYFYPAVICLFVAIWLQSGTYSQRLFFPLLCRSINLTAFYLPHCPCSSNSVSSSFSFHCQLWEMSKLIMKNADIYIQVLKNAFVPLSHLLSCSGLQSTFFFPLGFLFIYFGLFLLLFSHKKLLPVLDVLWRNGTLWTQRQSTSARPTRSEDLAPSGRSILTFSHPEWMICHSFVSLGQSSHSVCKSETESLVRRGEISAISEIRSSSDSAAVLMMLRETWDAVHHDVLTSFSSTA